MENYFDILNQPLEFSMPTDPYAVQVAAPVMKPSGIAECIDRLPLAMAYVPMQGENSAMYDDERALKAGTLFPDLDKPLMVRGGAQ